MRLRGRLDYVKKYEGVRDELKNALNNLAWDGAWFKRAFMDNGEVLGASCNKECRIDSIAQSWSIISGAGDLDKVKLAMENLENYLIDKDARYY